MPGHDSWFTFILPNYEELLARFREAMGLSVIGKSPVELQYVIGFIFISLVILPTSISPALKRSICKSQHARHT